MIVVILITAIIGAGIAAGGIIFVLKTKGNVGAEAVRALTSALAEREALQARFDGLFSQAVPIPVLRGKATEYASVEESLRAERGRVTITQAELETVENRLRELEEIERELEASGIETKEEMAILEKKRNELKQRNDTLKAELAAATERMNALMGEVEMTAQMQEQVVAMKTQLAETESRIDQLLVEIENSNEQYFILKKRYDALDIEYAQLYEKFSEAEALTAAREKQRSQ